MDHKEAITSNSKCPDKDMSGFDGWISGIQLPELVQFACLEGGDRILELEQGTKKGAIYFSKGQVVHAKSPVTTGLEAFYEMMCWQRGNFRLKSEKAPEISINMPWNFLVMEALRRIDEGREDLQEEGVEKELEACEVQSGTELLEDTEHFSRVLIVDDSPFFCKTLRRFLEQIDGVRVVGEASNGKEALSIIQQNPPDLVTLDINMPVMAGDLTLKHIMIRSPAPVLLISGFSNDTLDAIMDFVRLGAVDFVPKPMDDNNWEDASSRITMVTYLCQELRVRQIRRARTVKKTEEKLAPGPPAQHLVLVIGGLGGLLELQKLIPKVYELGPFALVVVQDMDKTLLKPFASYLDRICKGHVGVVADSGLLAQGRCWITTPQLPLSINAIGGEPVISATESKASRGDFICRLIADCVQYFQGSVSVFVLSGAGEGLEESLSQVVKDGGKVFLQDPNTCLHPRPLEKLARLDLSHDIFLPDRIQGLLPSLKTFEAGLGQELLEGLSF